MENLEQLNRNKTMCLATAVNNTVHASVVNTLFLEKYIIFGSFNDTIKCQNILSNTNVALTTGNYQILGTAAKLEKSNKNFLYIHNQYSKKFPYLENYIHKKNNDYYIILIKQVTKYDYSKNPSKKIIYKVDDDKKN